MRTEVPVTTVPTGKVKLHQASPLARSSGRLRLISVLALEPDLVAGRLVTLPLKGLEIERSLSAIRRAGGHRNEQARRFWSWLPTADK